jgi:hypothetical protein
MQAFVVIHTVLDVRPSLTVSRGLTHRRDLPLANRCYPARADVIAARTSESSTAQYRSVVAIDGCPSRTCLLCYSGSRRDLRRSHRSWPDTCLAGNRRREAA